MLDKIPQEAVYIGLGAALLAPLVAGIYHRSLQVTFILFLRLAIGWHFLFEGLHKVHSEYVGKTETQKPFTSEGYFRNSTGPLSQEIRKHLPDPDKDIIERFTPRGEDGMPASLDAEWNAYFAAYIETFKLDGDAKQRAEAALNQAKADYVKWIQSGKKKLKRDYPKVTAFEYEKPYTAVVEDLQHELKKITEYSGYNSPKLFADDVARAKLAQAKADAAAIRLELEKDSAAKTAAMKTALFDIFRKDLPNLTLTPPKVKAGEKSPTKAELLTSLVGGTDPLTTIVLLASPKPGAKVPEYSIGREYAPTPQEMLAIFPENLSKVIEEYRSKFAAAVRLNPEQIAKSEELTALFKQRYACLLVNADPDNGMPLSEVTPFVAAREKLASLVRIQANQEGETRKLEPEVTKLINESAETIAGLLKDYVVALDGLVTKEMKEVELPPVKGKTRLIDWIDFSTRWGLVAMGTMLLFGLLTRLACLMVAGFLVMTYLSVPAYPWLTAPPNTEGNYVFINKNVIELLAVLVIATTPSGRWLGIDALIHRYCCRPKPTDETTDKADDKP